MLIKGAEWAMYLLIRWGVFFVYAKSFETSNQADSHKARKLQTTAC